MKIPKTFLLFFILIMLIMPISSLGLVSSSEDVAMDNPYGEGRWRLKNAGIQILYNHEEEDYDYLVKNSSFSTNKISIETIEESQNHVEVLLNLEIGFVTSLDRSDYEEHLEEGPIDEELLDAVHIGYDMYIDKDEAELLDDDEGWLVKEEDVKRYRLEKDDEKINIYSIQFEERIDFDYTELRF